MSSDVAETISWQKTCLGRLKPMSFSHTRAVGFPARFPPNGRREVAQPPSSCLCHSVIVRDRRRGDVADTESYTSHRGYLEPSWYHANSDTSGLAQFHEVRRGELTSGSQPARSWLAARGRGQLGTLVRERRKRDCFACSSDRLVFIHLLRPVNMDNARMR